MTDKTYNGWTNYETWCVKLWMDNEESSYNYWNNEANAAWWRAAEQRTYPTQTQADSARCMLADILKEYHEENAPQRQSASLYVDLMNAALSEVNWYEIAEALLAEYQETVTSPS